MKNLLSTQACRHCRYYTPEGRRGGFCQQLNVEVQGSWKACSLALPPFMPAWENLEEILAQQPLTVQTVLKANSCVVLESVTIESAVIQPPQAALSVEPEQSLV
ncbi:MAG TPA: hypothetical protein V6D18_11430 [Thermosynechococcaceae cyanobacterium]